MSINKLSDEQSIFLDIVRLFLSIVVLIGHGLGFFLNYLDGFFPNYFPHPQSIAVVCFFYLSGFLIVSSQINQKKDGRANLYKYLFDRGFRVYLTLVPSLLFVVIADSYIDKFSAIKIDLISNYTTIEIFFNNLLLLPSVPFGTMRPIWSLMYEWWIYLFFGGVFFLRVNKLMAPILIGFSLYYIFEVNANGEAGHIWIIWVLGGFCAYIYQKISKLFWLRHKFAFKVLSFIFLVAALIIYSYAKNAYSIPAGITISLFMFLVMLGEHKILNNFNVRFVKLTVGISFTLFMTHYTVLTYMKMVIGVSGWFGLVSSSVLAMTLAFVIAYFTELKLQAIKSFILDKFLKYQAD